VDYSFIALICLVNNGNVRGGIGPANAGTILQGRTSLIRQRSILCGDMIFSGGNAIFWCRNAPDHDPD
jgi:hypothetical protein